MVRAFAILLLLCSPAWAEYRTANFNVRSISPQWEKALGDAAEQYRKDMANLWIGKELPQWSTPCVVNANVENKNYGSTTFVFDRGEVFGFDMRIHGTPERLIDSVLKHEITHTVFASHFRQPLPRWADEGACCSMEHDYERCNWDSAVIKCLKTKRGIPFRGMFAMMDYPQDFEALYAQGYSVVAWLIESYGREKFIAFLEHGLADHNWDRAVLDVYGFATPLEMQTAWVAWFPGPHEHAVAQCGSGGCSNGACWGPANQVYPPRQIPQPIYQQPRPSAPPVAVKPVQPPAPAFDWSEYDKRQAKLLEAIAANKCECKPCECKPTDLKPIQAQLTMNTTAIAQLAKAIDGLKVAQPNVPTPAPGKAEPSEPQISYYDIVPRQGK